MDPATSTGHNPAPASEAGEPVTDKIKAAKSKPRFASIYDAVAGRLTSHRYSLSNFRDASRLERSSKTQSSLRETRLAPEESLFRHKGAPERYAEHDIYFSNEDLPDGGRDILPGSDLVKIVHSYSSRFYNAMARRQGAAAFQPLMKPATGGGQPSTPTAWNVDERSMDETALLAFGILLEEASREVLGKKGDLVFTEGVGEEEEQEQDRADVGAATERGTRAGNLTSTARLENQGGRFPKRRKLDDGEEG